MKIAIQGIEGSFHHEAAEILAEPDELVLSCQKTFSDVFNAIDQGSTIIENNLHGSINAVYRLLDEYDVWVVRDVRMQITQNLIGKVPVGLADLGGGEGLSVLSHPVALAQVEKWLDTNLPKAERIERDDTASSVQEVVSSTDLGVLAIAGNFAAALYGGNVIAPKIQDEENNYTRFIMFQRDRSENPEATHGSLILNIDHRPGSLYNALGVFVEYGCNLTKLDSHPVASDEQHYQFYVDYELNISNGDLLRKLKAMDYGVKLLGYYDRAEV